MGHWRGEPGESLESSGSWRREWRAVGASDSGSVALKKSLKRLAGPLRRARTGAGDLLPRSQRLGATRALSWAWEGRSCGMALFPV